MSLCSTGEPMEHSCRTGITRRELVHSYRGLWASWDEGVPASCISDLLARHVSAGGVIVGWELHGDLEVIGFEKVSITFSPRRSLICVLRDLFGRGDLYQLQK